MLSRFFKLLGGKFSRWIKAREARDPEAVYESAISDGPSLSSAQDGGGRRHLYAQQARARVARKAAEMKEVDEEAGQAADMNEDQCALILIQRKHILDGDCTRLREELGELTTEAEDAKKNLISFKGEIEKLKVEKVRMIARMRNAQARVRIQRALEEISYDDDVRALEEVRESIQRMLAQAGVNHELAGSELGDKLEAIRVRNAEAKAQAELADLKRKRRPPLAPMDIFTAAAKSAANGDIRHAN